MSVPAFISLMVTLHIVLNVGIFKSNLQETISNTRVFLLSYGNSIIYILTYILYLFVCVINQHIQCHQLP